MQSLRRIVNTWTTAVAVLLTTSAVAAQPRPSDPATPTIEVSRAGALAVVLRVTDGNVLVEKRISPARSETTVKTRGDEIAFVVAPRELIVRHNDRTLHAEAGQRLDFGRVLDLLRGSAAAADGRALLARLPVEPDKPANNALMLTRAFLELPVGITRTVSDHRQWVRESASTVRLVRVQDPHDDPGYCWDAYAREAIQIADEFVDCRRDLHWYSVFDALSCDALYVMQAELDMMWVLNCAGPIPWK